MRLLVFNCHEAWVYQLGSLNCELDIIVNLPGRHVKEWDTQMRPVPQGARLIELADVPTDAVYDCIVTHNISDLLAVKHLTGPRLIVLHINLHGRIFKEQSDVSPEAAQQLLTQYLQMVGGHAVAVTQAKGDSWGFPEDVVQNGADPDDYLPYQGNIAAGLRISNQITLRKDVFMWDFHQQVFDGLPVRVVGHNPDMPGVEAAKDWDDLKQMLSQYRFYINTADPQWEDGVNMATLEAMAAGMPVIGNCNPTSPVKHGVSGFLSDDPLELRGYAELLLADRELAATMGEAARQTVIEHFSLNTFAERFRRSIQVAQQKWQATLT